MLVDPAILESGFAPILRALEDASRREVVAPILRARFPPARWQALLDIHAELLPIVVFDLARSSRDGAFAELTKLATTPAITAAIFLGVAMAAEVAQTNGSLDPRWVARAVAALTTTDAPVFSAAVIALLRAEPDVAWKLALERGNRRHESEIGDEADRLLRALKRPAKTTTAKPPAKTTVKKTAKAKKR
jgi:hypothetical protein